VSREIKSVWGYARTTRQRITRVLEQAGLPSNCYLCRRRFIHRSDHKVPHEWHHKNGNPFDNRKRNFVPLCSGCHSEVHVFAIQTYLLVSWSRLGMRIDNAGMTYVTKSGKFFIKSSPEQLRRRRPRRFMKLAESLRRWARELARATILTKTKRRQYQDRLLLRNLREAIRVAVPTERVIMQGLLRSLRRA
jgi:5-methylcytosine-specific restriction endonuclease McrA